MAFLSIEKATKRYGDHEVLTDIDLEVDRHKVVSLIGASGSGKSTLLRCINGLEEIQKGRIVIDGDQVSGIGVDLVRLRRQVGMVFQSYNLFPHMTVLRNCTMVPVETKLCGKEEAAERAMEMLKRVGLSDKANAYPDQLSGGQQQRVAIVRTMLMNPAILLLDEVTAALDPELVAEVLELIRELAARGLTMVLTTHEMAFARELSDTVCFLRGGHIHEMGPPEQIFGDPQQEATRNFLRRIREADRL